MARAKFRGPPICPPLQVGILAPASRSFVVLSFFFSIPDPLLPRPQRQGSSFVKAKGARAVSRRGNSTCSPFALIASHAQGHTFEALVLYCSVSTEFITMHIPPRVFDTLLCDKIRLPSTCHACDLSKKSSALRSTFMSLALHCSVISGHKIHHNAYPTSCL